MLGRPGGARFAMLHEPADDCEIAGSIVYVHPFAEELNKARRAAAVAAQQFSRQGWSVLLIDLLGCGDSSGDFEDATWDAWLDDIEFAAGWLQERTRRRPLLWSIRSGSLLVSCVLPRLGSGNRIILWQPALAGQTTLTQFLRLRVASEAFADAGTRTSTSALREQLAAGVSIEVSGYRLAPGLALPMDTCELWLSPQNCAGALWVEAAVGDDISVSAASRSKIDKLHGDGLKIEAHAVRTDPFWQTQETTTGPAMVDLTCGYLAGLKAT